MSIYCGRLASVLDAATNAMHFLLVSFVGEPQRSLSKRRTAMLACRVVATQMPHFRHWGHILGHSHLAV